MEQQNEYASASGMKDPENRKNRNQPMTKAEKIQQLVQEMKAGTITKSDLFQQLSQFHKQSKGSTPRSVSTASSTQQQQQQQQEKQEHYDEMDEEEEEIHESRQQDSTVPPPPSSKSQLSQKAADKRRRDQIIQKLFEEKRRQRQQQRIGTNENGEYLSPVDTEPSSAEYSSSSSSYYSESFNQTPTQNHHHQQQQQHHQQQMYLSEAQEFEQRQHSLLPESYLSHSKHSRPNSASGYRQTSTPMSNTSNHSGRGGGRNFMYDSRIRRLHEELKTKQMSECTFKPKIRELPDEYGVRRNPQDHLSFQERIDRWKHRKMEENERKRREKETMELKDCTFKPKINRNARPSSPGFRQRPSTADGMMTRRNNSIQRDQDEQSLNFSPYSDQNEGGSIYSNGTRSKSSTHERLYQQSKSNKLAQLQARARAEKEEQLRKECTFKPKIHKSEPYVVRSRYKTPKNNKRPSSAPRQRQRSTDRDSASSSVSSVNGVKKAWDENCTFTPQTNPIKPNMEAAQIYLSNDIVSRLTQPKEVLYRQAGVVSSSNNENNDSSNEPTFDDDRVIDMSTFLSSASSSKKRPSSAPRQRPGTGEKPKMTKEEAAERRRSFENFLVRQRQQQRRKEQKIRNVAKQIEKPHAPQLCKKSVEIAKERAKGSFLDRVAKGVLRKEHENVRLKSQNLDPECTFKPKINESSKRRPGRSAIEMSRGDSLRRETNARMMKLRMEQEELEDLTFTPEVNQKRGVESRLKILSEPETYVRRLQHKMTLHSQKTNKAAQEQEMKELEECTFKPEIHDAPSYVKRIARSLALAKPVREAQAAAQRHTRPDWR